MCIVAIESREHFRVGIIILIIFLITSIFQFIPFNISITEQVSASSTWSQSSKAEFVNGNLDQTKIEGSGDGAYITLYEGQFEEVLTSFTEYIMGGSYDIFNTGYRDGRVQSIYLASELKTAGFTAGHIKEVHLKCYESPGRPSLKNFRIRLQNTGATTSMSWVTSGWTLVFGPTDVIPMAKSWYAFTLTTPFYWDGASNLLLDLSRDDDGSSYSGAMHVRGYFSNSSRMYACRTDSGTWPYDTMWGNTFPYVPSLKLSSVIDSGSYTSQAYDTQNVVDWGTISWNAITPPGTSVKFQLRSAMKQSELASKWFVGPDGTSATYYTTGGEEIYAGHDLDNWIQYKAILTTESPSEMPKLHGVTITYNCLPNAPELKEPDYDIWTNDNRPKFAWTFSDPDSISQSAFQWQADDNDNFSSVDHDSGEIFSIKSSYTPTFNIPDGTWFWRIRTKDSDGTWGPYSKQGKIKIDTTINMPSNLRITPNNWTKSNQFSIEWTNPSDDSGIKIGAYYYIGNLPPTEQSHGTWVNTKPIIITDAPNGENTVYIWLEDNVGNHNYTKYSSGVIKLDLTPPDPPINVIITPDYWTSEKSFTVDWTNPYDHSGIRTGAYYYIGKAPPTYSADGTWVSGKPFTITKAPEGESNIYIWLEDKLGNSNFHNYTTTTLKLDTTPPTISHIPVTKAIHGREIKLDVEIFDDGSGDNEVLLFLKRTTDLAYATLPMNKVGEYYTITIPGDTVSEEGLEYYLKALDNADPNNFIFFGLDGETKYEPSALTDINIIVSPLPSVTNYSPKGDEAAIDSNITVTFNKSMEILSTEDAFSISPNINGLFSWNDDYDKLIFSPKKKLAYNNTYTIKISNKAKDEEDNKLVAEFQWSFTTENVPKQDEEPTEKIHEKADSGEDNDLLYNLVGLEFIIILLLIIIFLLYLYVNKNKKSEAKAEKTEPERYQPTVIFGTPGQTVVQPMTTANIPPGQYYYGIPPQPGSVTQTPVYYQATTPTQVQVPGQIPPQAQTHAPTQTTPPTQRPLPTPPTGQVLLPAAGESSASKKSQQKTDIKTDNKTTPTVK